MGRPARLGQASVIHGSFGGGKVKKYLEVVLDAVARVAGPDTTVEVAACGVKVYVADAIGEERQEPETGTATNVHDERRKRRHGVGRSSNCRERLKLGLTCTRK